VEARMDEHNNCCVCEISEKEASLMEIYASGNHLYICSNCHFLATKKIVVKCIMCGSVTAFPRSWLIFERLMEMKEYDETMTHFFQQACVVFYPKCPHCNTRTTIEDISFYGTNVTVH
jgi:hypothetical protein